MDADGIKKLEKEQKKALETCQAKIEQWEKYKKDYEDLRTNLCTLSEKVSHEIMVPFGSLALLPGKLIHTNEIMVLLGENWFVERSSKQACEIVGRRLLQCDDMLKKLHEEEKQFTDWMEWTSKIEDESKEYVEIIEEYDPEKEKIWREEHRKNVQRYRQSRKKDESSNLEEYFSKMEKHEENSPEDEVEVINKTEDHTSEVVLEPAKKDLTRLVASTTSGPSKASGDSSISHNRGRRVSWHDETITLGNDDSDSSDESDSPLIINFSHTTDTCANEDDVDDDNGNNDQEGYKQAIINCPADIYIHFASWFQKTPKSILKPSTPVPRTHDLETIPSLPLDEYQEAEASSATTLQPQISAVTEFVVEKETKEALPPPPKRPTSRFKAQRQGSRR